MGILIVLIMWVIFDFLHYFAYKFCKRDCMNVGKCRNWMCKKYNNRNEV